MKRKKNLSQILLLMGIHIYNTTQFSCIFAEQLRNGKTIIEEEHDKLVSVMAHSEFHLSSKSFHHESHLIEPPKWNEDLVYSAYFDFPFRKDICMKYIKCTIK
ncbi:hypothetical protein CRENBAI_019088 [Crenichthys baileyi]|uniref:Uncharacterized protein n=1 Tax=Crenichthys baileyi TaxID=28760 RepID=A0AAV9R0L7_9TELE